MVRETKEARLVREAREKAERDKAEIDFYWEVYLPTLERACNSGLILKVKDLKFVVTSENNLVEFVFSEDLVWELHCL